MSMIGNYRQIAPQELAALHADPASVLDFLYPRNGSCTPPGRHLDIDKAWHAVHFLLNGDPWEGPRPLLDVVLGGTPVGEVEVGYGPARFLAPEEVEVVARALEALSAVELLEHFHANRLNDAHIYPHGWTGALEEVEYVHKNYLAVSEFFRKVAAAKDAMLLYLS
jgi:hypothetical protein